MCNRCLYSIKTYHLSLSQQLLHQPRLSIMSRDKEIDEMLDECFKAIDVDNSGFLDVNEILNVLTHINNHPCIKTKKTPQELAEDAKNVMEGLDVNNDNKISRSEFEDFFKQRIPNA